MSTALQLIYYIASKLMDFMFNSYFFADISLGMLFIVCAIFVIMLRYLLAVPKIKVGFRSIKENTDVKK